jgi:peptidoglycan/xylan/chitin deacetylase (PgdA/CDA1 family)
MSKTHNSESDDFFHRHTTSIFSFLINKLGYPMTLSQCGGAILMYHVVDEPYPDGSILRKETFRQHLDYLTNRAEIVDIPQIYDTDCQPPIDQIALTFDGGYSDFYHTILPLLREYEVPATVFTPSERIGMNNEKNDEAASWVNWFDFMTDKQVKELVTEPLITIGNKTLTHEYTLPELSKEECEWEVVEGKRQLEERFDIDIDRFCFPCGDFDKYSLEVVKEHHDYAVTTQPNFVNEDSDPLRLPRFTADWTDVATLNDKLSNYYVFKNNFRKYINADEY